MEKHIINVKIETKGEKCEMNDEEIYNWYKEKIEGLFNPEYGKPEISIDFKRMEI